jgi:long-chain acyl-CoA synthetase
MSIHSWDVLETYRDNLFTGTWPSIPQMFLITLEEHSERNAFTIIENSNKKTLTYKQVYQKVLDVAFYLKENEIKKGDRIILNGKNSPNWAIAYLGILFAGATVVPLDNQLHIERVENLTAFSQVKAIFADSDVLNKFSKEQPNLVVSLDENKNYFNLDSIEKKGVEIAHNELPTEDDIAAILYTSGTTGNEKGVILNHANLVSNVYQACDPEFLTIVAEDVFYALLPLHHSYSMTAVFLEALKNGCEVVFGQSLVVSKVLNEMRQGNVTLFLAIPLLYNKFLAGLMKKVKEKGVAAYALIKILMTLNGLLRRYLKINMAKKWFHQLLDGIGMANNKLCICGGGPLSPQTFKQYQQLGLDFIQGYGLTETSPILTLNPVSKFKVTSVGKVLPLIEMRIAKADFFGNGEVEVRGPNICQGYFKDAENTAALFTDDGFLKTGDLGHLDKENYLYLKGRAKNLIVTEGGKNVYPEEIEDLFQHCDQVEQIMIRGYVANRASLSEAIEAVIFPNLEHYGELKYSKGEIKADLEKIVTEINRKLIAYKKVTKITILDKPMAMTSTKKIQRQKVD